MKKFTSILFLFFFFIYCVNAQNGELKRSRNILDVQQSDIVEQQKPVNISSEWEMDFEDIDDFSLEFLPWTVIDGDMGQTYGIEGYSYLHKEQPMAFIAFNPAATTPSLGDDDALQPHGGDRFGACFSSVPPNTNDDWLISPQLVLGSNSSFSFYVKSYSDNYGLDKYEVAVSISGNEIEDFAAISEVLEAPVAEWEYKSFNLSNFDSDTVYVAIHCVSEDNFIFMVDDIVINSTMGISHQEAFNVKVFPNPVSSVVYIENDERIRNLRILDLSGNLLVNQRLNSKSASIDISHLVFGIYVVKVITEKGVAVIKIRKN